MTLRANQVELIEQKLYLFAWRCTDLERDRTRSDWVGFYCSAVNSEDWAVHESGGVEIAFSRDHRQICNCDFA